MCLFYILATVSPPQNILKSRWLTQNEFKGSFCFVVIVVSQFFELLFKEDCMLCFLISCFYGVCVYMFVHVYVLLAPAFSFLILVILFCLFVS